MEDRLLTPDEVAELLRISVHTLAAWRRPETRNDLPWIEVGGSIRYRAADLSAWLERRTVSGT